MRLQSPGGRGGGGGSASRPGPLLEAAAAVPAAELGEPLAVGVAVGVRLYELGQARMQVHGCLVVLGPRVIFHVSLDQVHLQAEAAASQRKQ